MRFRDCVVFLQTDLDGSHLTPSLQHSVNKDCATVIRNEAVDGFAKAVSGMPKNAADERISFEMIRIDGHLASVWTPYQFYYEGKFSHCGVNSFQLVKLGGEWKIQFLIDTRRRQGCNQ